LLRGFDVIISSAKMSVVTQLTGLTAHDKEHLGVSLVSNHTVNDIGADLLQPCRKIDIRRLLKRARNSTTASSLPARVASISARAITDWLSVR
jgi:hypothetical protein